MNRPPAPSFSALIEPAAQDTRYKEQDDEIRGNRAEADVEGAER
jgi:hypothetical protein